MRCLSSEGSEKINTYAWRCAHPGEVGVGFFLKYLSIENAAVTALWVAKLSNGQIRLWCHLPDCRTLFYITEVNK